jgi:hypothetical protein
MCYNLQSIYKHNKLHNTEIQRAQKLQNRNILPQMVNISGTSDKDSLDLSNYNSLHCTKQVLIYNQNYSDVLGA